MSAEQPHGDADFQIDGVDVAQVCQSASSRVPLITSACQAIFVFRFFEQPCGHGMRKKRREDADAQVIVVGSVHNTATTATNVQYEIGDGTGYIDVRLWLDSADDEAGKTSGIEWVKAKPALPAGCITADTGLKAG